MNQRWWNGFCTGGVLIASMWNLATGHKFIALFCLGGFFIGIIRELWLRLMED